MGIERARVLELRSGGAGYLLDDRLVLTAGAGDVRPAGTATWLATSAVCRSAAGAALLELDDPSMLMMPPVRPSWGRVTGCRPVAVTAMGVPPSPSHWPRDPVRLVGHVVPGDGLTMAVTGPTVAGMTGAALFAGADLVGVLVAGTELRARPVSALAADPAFVEWVGTAGRLDLTSVSSPAFGLPIL